MTESLAHVRKPQELVDLHGHLVGLFDTLRVGFGVGRKYVLDLSDVDLGAELYDPTALAAMAMRKVQALRLAAANGEPVPCDVVVGLAAELSRTLYELACRLAGAKPELAAGLMDGHVRVREAARAVADLVPPGGEIPLMR